MNIPRVLRRFLIGYLLLHLIVAAVLVFVMTRRTKASLREESQNQMQAMAVVLRRHLESRADGIRDKNLPEHIKLLGEETEFRFTLIDPQGKVIADSAAEANDMGSLNDRREVVLAKRKGTGSHERLSDALRKNMIHLAVTVTGDPGEDATVIRVSKPTAEIESSIRSMQNLIWLFALGFGLLTGLLLAVFGARWMAPLNEFSQSARKIAEGSYDSAPSMLGRTDEWGTLAESFRHMQSELETRERNITEDSVKMSVVLSSMKEGVLAIDENCEIILANRAASKILTINREDFVGRQLFDLIRDPDFAEAVQKTLGDQSFSKTEFETTSTPRKTINARVAPISNDEDGEEILGATIVLNDVTDLRQLETMRQDFVANVSHELKTPLASIKAYAETLRLGAIYEDKTNIAFVKQIEAQAELLNKQIQDLLQIARVESGEQNWDIETVSVNQICESCVKQFESEASSRKITLHLDLDRLQPKSVVDVEGVRTILNNLISNAIHYTPAEGKVTVSSDVENAEVVLRVSDTGIGIAQEHQARIFERFYRVDKARSRDMGGTGLGLSIVKHLVQAFNGTVELESEVGAGSVFTIRLPAAI